MVIATARLVLSLVSKRAECCRSLTYGASVHAAGVAGGRDALMKIQKTSSAVNLHATSTAAAADVFHWLSHQTRYLA